MKQLLFSLILGILLLSCGNSSEFEQLQAERDSLLQIANNKDETINDFIQSFNEIEANLETIKQKENIISLKTHGNIELDDAAKDKINDDILAIYELMKRNNDKLTSLRKKLRKANILLQGLFL